MFDEALSETRRGQPLDRDAQGDADALQLLPWSDWARLWANLPARHLPESLAREVQFAITSNCLNIITYLAALASVATSIVAISLVSIGTTTGLIWIEVHIFEYLLIAATASYLRRQRRKGLLTTRMLNEVMIVPVILAGVLWGTLPVAVGRDNVEVFYLATVVSALFCSVGFFWTLGHWPLSMTYAGIILAALIWSYVYLDGPGTTMILLLGPVYLVALFGISVMAQIALVFARYYQVTARERDQLIGLILQDYDRGGHDFLWDTDSRFRLTHVPPLMIAAARGDARIAPNTSLLTLIADDPDALAAIDACRPFQAVIRTDGVEGPGEIRLWGRPKLLRGEVLGYRGIGSDEEAARRAAESERIGERLDAMVTLTSGLAHDFNNQLATVLGSIELAALEPDLPSSTLDYLHRAVDACLRTRRITGDLVVASGYDATYQPAPFELSAAATEVIEDLRPIFADVHLELDAPSETWVVADRSHYVRALRNLTQNACQAVGDAEPEFRRVIVRIDAIAADGPELCACTEVRDFGFGVPPDLAEQIFEPFATTRRDVGGSGLGLAVARGFARQAGGALSLEPCDRGASFRLLIPVADDPQPVGERVAGPAAELSERPLRLSGRFLVVEDDRQVADNLAALLRWCGAEADVAKTVTDAINRFAGNTADVQCVISDLLLPDGEGYEVIAALRQQDPDLRAIYMSGFTRTLPADVAAELQCPFLAKPFSITELSEALQLAGVPVAAPGAPVP